MPARNVLKQYYKDGYYHVYNRGVEKRDIFLSDNDSKKFIHYLEDACARYNIKLLNSAFLSNHFHLLIQQHTERGMEKLMRSLATRYTMYFNHRYDRVGKLFQGCYKARLLVNDKEIKIVDKYISNQETPGVSLW